jgi:hypothetical protein
MKRFVLAIALTGLVSVPVLAGNIPTNGVVDTPPPPTTTAATTTATAQPTTASTLLTNVVLIIITLIGR